MQMFKRLLLIVMLIVLSSGCAQPPVGGLESAQNVVAHAYAAGAAQYAPGEYQLASSALQAAELQFKNKEYRRASLTLELARRYSAEALKLTIARKNQLAAEQKKRVAEQQLIELAKQREIKRQTELREEQQRKLKLVVKPEPKETAPAATVISTPPPPALITPELVTSVEVKPGENLATIAAREEVYNDALLWPLIYKANRDQIKDPKEIFSGQVLLIPRDKNRDETEAARHEAQELNLFQLLN